VNLDFYFDFSSPFAYLGSAVVEDVAARHGATLTWKPILLGALFRQIGTPLVPIATFSDAKRDYILKDMMRWAEHREVELNFPSGFPLRTVKPLRLVLAADEASRPALVHRLMRLCWVEDGDPNDDAQLSACVQDIGGDEAWMSRIAEPEIKEALKSLTAEAEARGVPGVPTFVVGESLFWGQDRLHFVERALEGWKPEIG